MSEAGRRLRPSDAKIFKRPTAPPCHKALCGGGHGAREATDTETAASTTTTVTAASSATSGSATPTASTTASPTPAATATAEYGAAGTYVFDAKD